MKLPILLLVLSTVIAHAQFVGNTGFTSKAQDEADRMRNVKQFCRDPFRRLDGKPCDLRPLFTYWISGAKSVSPMPAWQLLMVDVANADARGILAYDFRSRENPVHIINYPLKNIPDGARLKLLAVESGTFSYIDIRGIRHTVKQYDYGVPYNPNDLGTNIVITTPAPALKFKTTGQAIQGNIK